MTSELMGIELVNKLRAEIKKELIDYYDSITNRVDVKAQELLKEYGNEEESEANDKKKLVVDENVYLIEQVKRVFDSNLNDINHFFDNLNQNDQNFFTMNINDQRFMKEEIKKRALKSYLICVNHNNYETFGLHLEFEWYIDENQSNFIRLKYHFLIQNINFSIYDV
jgi:hypothetical protein